MAGSPSRRPLSGRRQGALQELEDLRPLLDAEVRLPLRLHAVDDRGPVAPLAGRVRAMAGGALGAVEALLFRQRTRRRRRARRRERKQERRAKAHRLIPSTDRTNVPPAVSPTPKPAPTWSQIRLDATEIDGPT